MAARGEEGTLPGTRGQGGQQTSGDATLTLTLAWSDEVGGLGRTPPHPPCTVYRFAGNKAFLVLLCVQSRGPQCYLLPKVFPGGSDGKESACNAGDLGSVPELGRSPEAGNGYPLQYPCLENPVDRGTWRATVLGVTKSQPQLNTCNRIKENTPIYRHHQKQRWK